MKIRTQEIMATCLYAFGATIILATLLIGIIFTVYGHNPFFLNMIMILVGFPIFCIGLSWGIKIPQTKFIKRTTKISQQVGDVLLVLDFIKSLSPEERIVLFKFMAKFSEYYDRRQDTLGLANRSRK